MQPILACLGGTLVAASALAGPPCLGCGVETVEHQTLAGETLALLRYPGPEVDLLVPPPGGWPHGLAGDEVERVHDLLQIAAAELRRLVGPPPEGAGALPVALVPEPGPAPRGARGLEIGSDVETVAAIREGLTGVSLPRLLLEGLVRAFDLAGPAVDYLPAHADGWARLLTTLVASQGGLGDPDHGFWQQVPELAILRPRSPGELLASELDRGWGPYLSAPGHDWRQCVERDHCELDQLAVWSGPGLETARLWGAAAVTDALAELLTLPIAGSDDAEAAEDRWIEALSAGSRSNLSCAVDAWRWQASDDLRERLADAWPAPRECSDRDGDGWAPVTGDCDDGDPSIHPAEADPPDGRDSDCDGLVDEQSVDDGADDLADDLLDATPVGFPAEISGRLRGRDVDWLALEIDGTIELETRICGASGHGVVLTVHPPDGGRGTYQVAPPGGCAEARKLEADPGTWRVEIRSQEGSGDYRAQLRVGDPWSPAWGRFTRAKVRSNGTLKLKLQTDDPGGIDTPDEIRFWLAGVGWIATKRWKGRVGLVWRPDEPFEPGPHGVRAQLLAGGRPVSPLTPLHRFEVDE